MSTVSDNFIGTAGDAFTGDSVFTVVAGSPVYVANHYGVAVQFPGNAQVVISQPVSPGTSGPLYASAILKFATLPTATAAEIFSARNASNARTMQVQIGNDGKLRLYNAANTLLATSASSVPIGADFRISIIINGTTATVKVFPDATSATASFTISGTIVSDTATVLRWGPNLAGGIGTTLDFAWPMLDTATEPGARKYVYLTADKTSGIVPETVAVTVAAENLPAGTVTYTVDFGDGTVVGPQSSASFTHTYTTAGDWSMTPKADVT